MSFRIISSTRDSIAADLDAATGGYSKILTAAKAAGGLFENWRGTETQIIAAAPEFWARQR